ncbi:MAG TPA: Gmad2 immunoglobulin-like domain-containing protein [Actinomycetota bacterium]|nr:Gmad2 immunoglobulin-like domain-containing protein [Actinomycetota bacterium]
MKRLIVLLTSLALAATACGERRVGSLGPGPDETPVASESPRSPEPTPSQEPAGETMRFQVWFAYGEGLFVVRRTVEATPRIGTAALEALLAGPTREERAAGVSSAVPEGTELRSLTIEDGVATVDLSAAFEAPGGAGEETMRLGQLVFTLTQFPTVDGVALEIEGRPVESFGGHGIALDPPMERRDYADLLPQILVEEPAIGDRVTSPVTIAGTADVFEATVSIGILDANGNEIVRTFTTATCGTGCRGDYQERVEFSVPRTQPGTIVVYESSAEDGSPLHVVEIPVTLVA